MADAYLSGLTGGVLVGGTPYSFGKWKLGINTKLIPRNNFTVAGFQRLVSGFTKGTITLDGPYNAGNMPIVSGALYQFTLQWTASLAIVVNAIVGDLNPDNNAEEAPNVNVVAQTTGVFTAAIT